MLKFQILKSIFDVKENEWDALVPREFPFLQFRFLSALESTGCLGARTGWEPCYLTVSSGAELQGGLIAYARNNSFGEYIFDFAWADAYANHGQNYYPKLVSAIPFTPATCAKILYHPNLDSAAKKQVATLILSTLKNQTEKASFSSAHALFVTPEEIPDFQEHGFFIRNSFQYHWKNQKYKNFQDFLDRLRSKRRKEIQRERTQVQDSRVQVSRLTGSQLKPIHAKIMYEFYISTMEKKSGFDFLTAEFFEQVFATMPEQILFVLAEDAGGKAVAGALNFFGPQALYGRQWGCLAEYRALHFELCYYQGIEFAIERGIPLFEAGAQGEHKFNRGFLPALTYSAHFIQSQPFAQAIQKSVEYEKRQLEQFFISMDAHTPFARGP